MAIHPRDNRSSAKTPFFERLDYYTDKPEVTCWILITNTAGYFWVVWTAANGHAFHHGSQDCCYCQRHGDLNQ